MKFWIQTSFNTILLRNSFETSVHYSSQHTTKLVKHPKDPVVYSFLYSLFCLCVSTKQFLAQDVHKICQVVEKTIYIYLVT